MPPAAAITPTSVLRDVFVVRWKPNKDLAAITLSWILVVAAIYTATNIVGREVWGGMGYFFVYAVLGAALFGVGIPLYWTVVVRKRPIADLGLTSRWLVLSVVLQLVFAALQYIPTLSKVPLPPLLEFLPVIALALTIGFFEAIFWRGWILLRLEDAFGLVPALLVGSALYAAYHIGYGMPMVEMYFLFLIGIMYAVAFRITKSIWVLWPLFQPMGQLVTLVRDRLSLPLIATLGFLEALVLMAVLVWLAARHHKKHIASVQTT